MSVVSQIYPSNVSSKLIKSETGFLKIITLNLLEVETDNINENSTYISVMYNKLTQLISISYFLLRYR